MKRILPLFLILLLLLTACGTAVPAAQPGAEPAAATPAPSEEPLSPDAEPTPQEGPDEDELPIIGPEGLLGADPTVPDDAVPVPGETVTLDGISSYLRVDLPEGWTWEQAVGTVKDTVYCLYPADDPAFKVELHYWAEGFPGLCGTGMSFSDYTLPDGRKANIAYEVSDEEIWWWMTLPESPDSFSIQFGAPYALYESHRAELEQMLSTIRQGVLAGLTGPDVVKTDEPTG